jgi:two-component system sensor histidine kinase DegS
MTVTRSAEPSPTPDGLAARLAADVATLDGELAEIDMLVAQVRGEAARHEQKRAQAAERIGPPGRGADATELAEAYAALVLLTKRAVLMESQVDLLEGKRRALARHRDALASAVEALTAPAAAADGSGGGEVGSEPGSAADGVLPPSLARIVRSTQEDLRRDIARAMHDGPAQSLTNIVLQAQVVDRLVERDPAQARGELRLLVSMVQQTLEATKTFIFDVRPMVLDDLGLVPTLRRSARDRGRRAGIPVEFDSHGQDRRLSMEAESAVFRIVDEALGAYLGLGPDRVEVALDWSDVLEARVVAHRAVVLPEGLEPLPEVPTGDVPAALQGMIQERHDARQAIIDAAEQSAIVVLPPATAREVAERAASIGAELEVRSGGGEVRLAVPLPAAEGTGGS